MNVEIHKEPFDLLQDKEKHAMTKALWSTIVSGSEKYITLGVGKEHYHFTPFLFDRLFN